jgi:hypothetical protein
MMNINDEHPEKKWNSMEVIEIGIVMEDND